MDQSTLYQQYFEMPSEDYQLYYDYTNWTAYNPNFYSSLPAYQELSGHKFIEELMIESVDLTQDQIEKSTRSRSKSPTQARDFKLLCEGCKRSFTSKKRLENHMVKCFAKKLERKAFNCRGCDRSFKKRSGLFKHTTKCHDGRNEVIEMERKSKEEERLQLRTPKPSIFHSVSLLAQSDSLW